VVSGNAALYQVAVALIPALLFGGAVLELRERPPMPRNPRLLGLCVAAILGAGVVAEIIAIRGAIDPGIGDLGRRFLVLVLTAGTTGLAIWIAAPLLRTAASGTRIHLGWKEVAAVLTVAVIAGQFAITESLDHAEKRLTLRAASEQIARTSRELNQAEQIELEARTQLLSLARSTDSDGTVAAVIFRLRQLDDQALGPVSYGNPGMSNAEHHVRARVQRMNTISADFERDIEAKIRDLAQPKRELLMVAWRRLISAVAPTIGDRETFFFATRQFKRACAEAAFLECH